MTDVAPARDHTEVLPRSVRHDFPILRQTFNGYPLTYLDNAATTQKPQAVLDAITDYYATANSNVGRGYYQLSMRSTDRYEQARAVVQRAVNAEHPDEIVFTAGTTAAVNLLADTFGRKHVGCGDEVVVTGMEHNSNTLPWRRLAEQSGARLVVVPVSENGSVDIDTFTSVLGPRVRLVAVSHVSNVLGTVNPVREMIAEAHRRDVRVVVDGAQAIAHRTVDVRDLDADFYCFSGHKVYGPLGVGVLYGKREILAELPPYQVGGGTVKGVTFTAPVSYVPTPARLEAGTPHMAGAVGLAAALRYLDGLGRDAVSAHQEMLVRQAVDALNTLDGVRVVGDPASAPNGIVSFVVDGIHPYDVGGHLDQHGIAVRSGVHCASTFLDSMDLVGTVRMSFAVYNTSDEIELVRRALETLRPGPWTKDRPTTRFL
ncbi:cysteine sulfinate desulfinase [Actinosynnema sp. ALI-1.44]|uniref:aminotransferase class V-fold PLP-dependent enzyme n=1 Tax=Actinosynnema sp. ALI-1.44 TaxID=1933779 RepID=UPI00097BC6F9|nr:cysteine desulfurase [Actinosynnema sp. ALI-1.44]ONI76329.1 cysteine sulfinate desulfinase [Actinosynnema sp. ALI-1.44]